MGSCELCTEHGRGEKALAANPSLAVASCTQTRCLSSEEVAGCTQSSCDNTIGSDKTHTAPKWCRIRSLSWTKKHRDEAPRRCQSRAAIKHWSPRGLQRG